MTLLKGSIIFLLNMGSGFWKDKNAPKVTQPVPVRQLEGSRVHLTFAPLLYRIHSFKCQSKQMVFKTPMKESIYQFLVFSSKKTLDFYHKHQHLLFPKKKKKVSNALPDLKWTFWVATAGLASLCTPHPTGTTWTSHKAGKAESPARCPLIEEGCSRVIGSSPHVTQLTWTANTQVQISRLQEPPQHCPRQVHS